MSDAIEKSEAKPVVRSADQIAADMEATRERLAGTIDTIKDKVSPQNLMKDSVEKVKGVFVKPEGGIRVERIAAITVAVVSVMLIARGRRSRKREKALAALPDLVWVPMPREQAIAAGIEVPAE